MRWVREKKDIKRLAGMKGEHQREYLGLKRAWDATTLRQGERAINPYIEDPDMPKGTHPNKYSTEGVLAL
eukprot:461673-Prorocentrum_lima.AAC.1